jgi:GT2 family glycosyltransferase
METAVNGRIWSNTPTRIDHPLGACMLIRRAAWEDVGPLDEGYFMYMEEIDWCRRARARGWEVWHQPAAVAIHHGGSSTRQQPRAMFRQLWRSRLRYYSRFQAPTSNRLVHVLVHSRLKNVGA